MLTPSRLLPLVSSVSTILIGTAAIAQTTGSAPDLKYSLQNTVAPSVRAASFGKTGEKASNNSSIVLQQQDESDSDVARLEQVTRSINTSFSTNLNRSSAPSQVELLHIALP